MNKRIRDLMKEIVRFRGSIHSSELVKIIKIIFPKASSRQISGNLSALCCHDKSIQYKHGMIS